MSIPVILSPDADREFAEAASWYERQANRGEAFIERVQDALDRIGQMPELHAAVYRNIRRIRVRDFPYNLYYRALADRVEVIAVFHHRRDPKAWQSRV
jgi:plasmid stabilization system protein ParE